MRPSDTSTAQSWSVRIALFVSREFVPLSYALVAGVVSFGLGTFVGALTKGHVYGANRVGIMAAVTVCAVVGFASVAHHFSLKAAGEHD